MGSPRMVSGEGGERTRCYPATTVVNRFLRSALFPLVVIVLLVYVASQVFMGDRGEQRKMTYSEAFSQVEAGAVQEVLFNPNRQSIELSLVDGEKAKVNYPTPQSATRFETLLKTNNVRYDSKGTGSSAW